MENPWVATNEDMFGIFNQCVIRDGLTPRSVYIDGTVPVENIEYRIKGGDLLFTLEIKDDKITLELYQNVELVIRNIENETTADDCGLRN